MAYWNLVSFSKQKWKLGWKLGPIGFLILVIAFPFNALSHEHGKVRIYKINKKDQFVRQKWLKDVDQPGCHNTLKSRQAHRFAQFGYEYCTIYAEQDCQGGTEVPATWQGKELKNVKIDLEVPQTQLIQGSEWFFHVDQNVEIKSWFCEYDPS